MGPSWGWIRHGGGRSVYASHLQLGREAVTSRITIRLWSVSCAVAALALPARGAELEVLAAGAVQAVVPKLAATFEGQTGHMVTFTYGTVGDLSGKAQAGQRVDVIILTPPALTSLEGKGLVRPGTQANVGSVGAAVAVRAGVVAPDVSTPEALRAALLSARSVIYADPTKASSGIHFARVIERLGIAEAVTAKAHIVPTGIVGMQDLAKDTGAGLVVGITQETEILSNPGVTLVGPLPGDLQNITTYTAALGAKPADPAAAEAFLAWLTNPAGKQAFAAAGFEVAP
jgi:molybdate transport system substrate-binding protein